MNETEFKTVAHHYLGNCDVIIRKSCHWSVSQLGIHKGETRLLIPTLLTEMYCGNIVVTPILRSLSDMTEDEAIQYLQIILDNLEDEVQRIDADEIQVDLHPGDGGNMVDGDIVLVIEFSCRCLEGQLAFTKGGSPVGYDEEGKIVRIDNAPRGFNYLLLKGFDLFQLLDTAQAILKPEPKATII
jgi:hypothetical protein